REAPVLIVRYENAEVKLGGGANAAANVRSLGGQVDVVGVIGRDEMGHELRRLLREQGMRLSAVSGPRLATETKTRILAGGLSTKRQQMLRLDRGGRVPLSAAQKSQLVRHIRRGAQSADAVLVSDYGAGVVDEEVRQELRALVRDGMPVCVDSRYRLRAFTGMSVVKPNEPELSSLVGRPLRSDAEVHEAGREALRLLQCQSLVVTRGRRGMLVFERDGRVEDVPVHGAHEAVDVTGAGDTVIAALTLALAAGANVTSAARLANVAGALVVQKEGTATVSRTELEEELGR
ncbi:MAG: PfkB family carbohydrate kinase, partial [Myxococcaceae bacterium]|nr:PfkB family carbohydrate kinase [Myxococcaceae bacterium]